MSEMRASDPAAATSAAIVARIRRVRAVVNPLSGRVDADAAEALNRLLRQHWSDVEVTEAAPDAIEEGLRAALDAGPDLLVLLAGDGTIRMGAALAGADGPLLAPLPGGTMNMLPHALYGAVPWRTALEQTLASGEVADVSGGEIGGRRFFVAAILGAPALWAPAREAVRKGRFDLAYQRARHALRSGFARKLRFQLDGGDDHSAGALTLMCPLVSRGLHRDDVLEALALNPKGAADAFRLGARTLLTDVLGDWRVDNAVEVMTCRSGRAWAKGQIPVILDGEPYLLGREAEILFIPKAFRALRPAPEPAPE
jgi:diacylglycerol kinase family enzyme